ncbi:ParB/RepB/Spo0J family partition protein [Oleidesulfovibrio sp.]|uniref:ParB/RepB/Spo0J family partition protein n=1 Tax=Oleidesulfovibrio sp. TaxID=2909707 RepID=UPI003A8505EA
MAAVQRGLGRGLDALFKGYQEETPAPAQGGATPNTLSIKALIPNPEQPRKHFSEEALQELADSIRSQGVLQPLLVRPAKNAEGMYEIIAGERRWRACQKAKVTELPVIIREMTDEETLAVALIENLQREDLNPMEEAQGMAQLKEQFGMNQEVLAAKLGKSRSAVANTMRLLNLPKTAQDDIAAGRLTAGHARTLLSVNDDAAREELRRRIVEEGLTVRGAELQATFFKENGTLPAEGEKGAGTSGKSASAPKIAPSASIISLREKLKATMPVKATISGSEEKGKVTLSFSSQEELARVLNLLGIQL